jgi:hypothetical protein
VLVWDLNVALCENPCFSMVFHENAMYNKTVIEFGVCDTQNYQELGISVLSLAFGSTDNT